MSEPRFFVVADETGDVGLYVEDAGGKLQTVSEQNGNWDQWVKLTKSLGANPGEALCVEFSRYSP